MVRLYIKPGVKLDGLTIWALDAIAACFTVWGMLGIDKLTITEATGGEHTAADSAHTVDYDGDEYYGYGIDVRTRNFPGGSQGYQAKHAADLLRDHLGDGYDIVLHTTHIHIEADRRALNLA